MDNLSDMPREKVMELISCIRSKFDKLTVRIGDTSTTFYFFNTKNSVNTILTITNNLLHDYQINPEGLKNE